MYATQITKSVVVQNKAILVLNIFFETYFYVLRRDFTLYVNSSPSHP